MSSRGEVGDVVETGGDDVKVFSLEWRIPAFPSLAGESGDRYESPFFRAHGGVWCLLVYPFGFVRNPPLSWVNLALCRLDMGPAQTIRSTLGIKGPEGVENERGRTQEIWREDRMCSWSAFCLRSKLTEQNSRLMQGDVFTVTLDMKLEVSSSVRGELPLDVLVIYSYKELQAATQNFRDRTPKDGGFKIGEGGFGTVYRAVIRGVAVAVKKLKDPEDNQFVVELKTLINYRHDNLVPLLGISLGTSCCLLYEYMPNGSLEDRLACKDQSEPLSGKTRLSISYGSALGINHLHTFVEEPVVHRDIKSANILLDQNWVPKVGDFGLVRTGDSGGSTTNPVTGRCMGTLGYMPKEALVGDVSVKWDTFSFGVVLLELLTGLPPFDKNRKHRFLITHLENCKDIISRLDPTAKWKKEDATKLYRIAQSCLAESKRSRPAISEILEDLRKLSPQIRRIGLVRRPLLD